MIADKGYISQQKFKIFNKEQTIVTPKRKNHLQR